MKHSLGDALTNWFQSGFPARCWRQPSLLTSAFHGVYDVTGRPRLCAWHAEPVCSRTQTTSEAKMGSHRNTWCQQRSPPVATSYVLTGVAAGLSVPNTHDITLGHSSKLILICNLVAVLRWHDGVTLTRPPFSRSSLQITNGVRGCWRG